MFNNATFYDTIELIIKEKNNDSRIQSTKSLVYENILAQITDGTLLVITSTTEPNPDGETKNSKYIHTVKVFPLTSIISFKTIC